MDADEVIQYLLSRIRDRSKLTLTAEPIELYPESNRVTGHYPWQKIPRAENHDRGIRKLAELGGIKLVSESLYKFSLLQPRFDELCIEYGILQSSLPYIYYWADSGVGYANRKMFQFTEGEDARLVFPEMYHSINHPVRSERIKKLLKTDHLGHRVNDMAKSMRKKTGLDTKHIIQKKGSLTLVGNKLDRPPN